MIWLIHGLKCFYASKHLQKNILLIFRSKLNHYFGIHSIVRYPHRRWNGKGLNRSWRGFVKRADFVQGRRRTSLNFLKLECKQTHYRKIKGEDSRLFKSRVSTRRTGYATATITTNRPSTPGRTKTMKSN